jgi:hypothetical protein
VALCCRASAGVVGRRGVAGRRGCDTLVSATRSRSRPRGASVGGCAAARAPQTVLASDAALCRGRRRRGVTSSLRRQPRRDGVGERVGGDSGGRDGEGGTARAARRGGQRRREPSASRHFGRGRPLPRDIGAERSPQRGVRCPGALAPEPEPRPRSSEHPASAPPATRARGGARGRCHGAAVGQPLRSRATEDRKPPAARKPQAARTRQPLVVRVPVPAVLVVV